MIDPEEVRKAWLSNNMETRHTLMERFSCLCMDIEDALERAGIERHEIYKREAFVSREKIRVRLELDEITKLNKCMQCFMIIADNPAAMPDGWKWSINGRSGDLCNGCYEEMKEKDRTRFNEMVNVGCIVCKREYGMYSVPEIHHLRSGRGVGQKKDHTRTIPLCPQHHRTGGYGTAFHAGQKEWESRHGKEDALLYETDKILLTSRDIL